MTWTHARWIAGGIFALIVLELAAAITFTALDPKGSFGNALFGVTFLLFPAVGLLIASRRPDNALGWLMLAIGVVAMEPLDAYGAYAIHAGLPAGRWAVAALSWSWIPTVGTAGTFLLLLFPDGHLPSPRWRWFAWTVAIGMVVASLGILLSPGSLADNGFPNLQNPFGIDAVRPLFPVIIVAIVSVPLGVLGSAMSLVLRYRRSEPVERQQIRWLASAAAIVAVVYAITMAATATSGWASSGWLGALQSVAIFLFALIPISIGVAVLKYRLYDIDVVIRKTVLYAVLAILILAIGLGLTWILSGLFASTMSGGRLDLIAGVVIGILFWPLRRLATRIADRVVFGGRATPYEVLTEFGSRLAGTYAADDVLPRIAKVLAEGMGAERARVWLMVDGELRPSAEWSRGGMDPDRPEDHRIDVRHQGELLGALSVTMPINDPMDPAKAKLVADLAAQAGLLLRNVALLEEIRASRRRLVAAQDQERRRLERNIHDGAQQQLVALAVKARLARTLTERDPAKAAEMLEQIESETQTALEDLRDLARGIYPPLLADKGLAAAIEAQARKSPLPVEVHAEAIERSQPEVEAAVYFSVLEALQNAAKYAQANGVIVRLSRANGDVRFEVADDGRGFDPTETNYGTGLQGISDRLGALDGTLTVESAPGAGTTLTGRVPT